MTQQALTIAVAPSGMTKLFNALVVSGAAFANQLDSETPSNQTLNVGDVPDTNISDYVLQLSGGSYSNASASLSSAAQQGAGSNQFKLSFSVNITVSFASWTESGKRAETVPHTGVVVYIPFGPTDCGAFGFTATGVVLAAMVQIVQNSQKQWEFSFVSPDADANDAPLSFGYPGASVLSQYNNSCSSGQIHDGMEGALNQIDYSTATQDAITPILDSITESGSLGAGIVFQWTPNTFVFPASSLGLQSGVTGLVTYNGTPFTPSGLTPPDLPLPAIPAGNDVQIYAADYLFTSLFWAYYSAGELSQTITPGMLAEPNLLNTSNFQDSIQALYQQYPNAEMEVVVEQSAAPQVSFIQGYLLPPPYILTPVALASLQGQLPAADYTALQDKVENIPFDQLGSLQDLVQTVLGGDAAKYGPSVVAAATTATASLASQLPGTVYSALLGIANIPYASHDAFVAALQQALGSGPAQQYGQLIEGVAALVLASLTHSPLCTFNVLSEGTWTQVFQIKITEQDFLHSFVLGVSGTAQTVQSQYQIAGNPTASLVSSNIPGVNASTFQGLWQYVLSPVYANVMQEVASAGVPVPFIEGYTFQGSTVSLQVGYADITANMMFS
jgi:hypothetical protein